MLTPEQYRKAKQQQQKLVRYLNNLSQDLSGEHNLEKVYKFSYHYQDLGYVLENLKDIHNFWFQEGEYVKE